MLEEEQLLTKEKTAEIKADPDTALLFSKVEQQFKELQVKQSVDKAAELRRDLEKIK